MKGQWNMQDRRGFLKGLSVGSAAFAMGASAVSGQSEARLFGGGKSEVALRRATEGNRREMIYDSLKPFKSEIERAIGDRRVVIKANAGLAQPRYAINSTHADQLRGILDFLSDIHGREVLVTEGTAGAKCSAFEGFENYGYMPLEKEYNVRFIDANDQPYTLQWIRAAKHRPQAINIIDLFHDDDVYLISAARMKTHNAVVATYSLKNVAMGSPVCHYKETNNDQANEKYKMHGGEGQSGGRELSYNMFLLAQLGVRPDLSVIDGIVAIEGDGPWGGEPVDHGVIVTGTDFVAADRVCTELMGIDPRLMKYLEWCSDAGMGAFDLADIDVKGADYKQLVKKYKLNKNFDWQVEWIYENCPEEMK